MFKDYRIEISQALEKISEEKVQSLLHFFESIITKDGTLYIAGNGGSHSLGDHFSCDFTKGSLNASKDRLQGRAVNLSNQSAIISALENDCDHQSTYSKLLQYLIRPGDGVLLISSSGKSANIVEARAYCDSNSIPYFILTGMDGLPLTQGTSTFIKIDSYNYGVIEDCHMSLLHHISQVI